MTDNATTLADINEQIKQHDELVAQLRLKAEEIRNHARTGVIEEILTKIAEYGLTASDLKLSAKAVSSKKSVAVKAAAKYRGPAGETWSGGRGRKPKWVSEALAVGKTLADFEIR